MPKLCFIKIVLITYIIGICVESKAQFDQDIVKNRTRNIAWFTPCGATKINGIAVGLQALNVNDKKLQVNGINVGAGLGTMMALPYVISWSLSSNEKRKDAFEYIDTASTIIRGLSFSFGGEMNVAIHGINISGGVTHAEILNGLSITGGFSKTRNFNGICISGLMNHCHKGRGLQIGLFNYCKNFKGLQIGLWNKSGKRGLPFINWSSKKEKIIAH